MASYAAVRDPEEAPVDGGEDDPRRVVEEAVALGIPWRRILRQEILAETMLQRFLGEPDPDLPLWRALCVLPGSFLHSWRVRASIERIAARAASGCNAARKELSALSDCLEGAGGRPGSRDLALARHRWFAYQRVLELRAVAECAGQLGTNVPHLARAIEERTGCSRRDAQWALALGFSGGPVQALEKALARAREEGFDIPVSDNDRNAFLELRTLVRRHGLLANSAGSSRARRRPSEA